MIKEQVDKFSNNRKSSIHIHVNIMIIIDFILMEIATDYLGKLQTKQADSIINCYTILSIHKFGEFLLLVSFNLLLHLLYKSPSKRNTSCVQSTHYIIYD